jgi:ACS family hexuronate transporter-like MFS transporter
MSGGFLLAAPDDRIAPENPGVLAPEKPWLEMTPRASSWAWGLCWLMFASTVLNYMNRLTITQVNSQVCEAFGIPDQTQFGWVLAAFFMTYALFQLPAGFLIDHWDLRWSYAGAVIWWSTAAIATAIVPTLGLLIAFRALLGVGESFNWPCGLRVTSRILPPQDRALGNGIFNSGAAVGAVVTPLIIQWLAPHFGWRVSFVVIGAAGYVWAAAWLFLVRGEPARLITQRETGHVDQAAPNSEPGRMSPTARAAFAGALIASVALAASALLNKRPEAVWLGIAVGMLSPLAIAAFFPRHHFPKSGWASSLADVVRLRRFWIMFVVSITINICWHFQVNWIPSFLKSDRHFGEFLGNYLSAVIYLAADLGNLGGGWASRWLAAKGLSVINARKVVVTCAMLMILAGLLVRLPQSDTSAMIVVSIMAAGTAAFIANWFSFCQDVSPRHTGMIVGYLGGLGNLFVAGYQPLAGWLRDVTQSHATSFLIVGLLPLAGVLAILLGWNDRKRETAEGYGGLA